MPMSERYYTVDGQMIGFEEGGVRKDFLTDHLGSIIAIMDENEVRVFDTRYSAYGRNRWITGTSCGFGWVGTYGYRETGLSHMSHYVRARHYSYVTGGWSTVDPLWPRERAYGYVGGRATDWTDPNGAQGKPAVRPKPWHTPACKEAFDRLKQELAKCFDPQDAYNLARILMCVAYGESDCDKTARTTHEKYGMPTTFGLLQLDCKQYNRFKPAECPPCSPSPTACGGERELGCNIAAAIAMLISLRIRGDGKNAKDLEAFLRLAFGVVGPGAENDKTNKCLKESGIDLKTMPIPKPKPECIKGLPK